MLTWNDLPCGFRQRLRHRKAVIDFVSYSRRGVTRHTPWLESNCFENIQWAGGADQSLQHAKEVCVATLPEPVVPQAAGPPPPRPSVFRPSPRGRKWPVAPGLPGWPARLLPTDRGKRTASSTDSGHVSVARTSVSLQAELSLSSTSTSPKPLVAHLLDGRAWSSYGRRQRIAAALSLAKLPKGNTLQGQRFRAPR